MIDNLVRRLTNGLFGLGIAISVIPVALIIQSLVPAVSPLPMPSTPMLDNRIEPGNIASSPQTTPVSIPISRIEVTSLPASPHRTQEVSDKDKVVVQNLIKTFNLIKPPASRLCHADAPWFLGESLIQENENLTQEDCFAIQIASHRDSVMYLFAQSAGEITQLIPNTCHALGLPDNRIVADQVYHLPLDDNENKYVIGLDDLVADEQFYLLLLDANRSADQLIQQISTIQTICADSENTIDTDLDLTQVFEKLQRHYGNDMHWEAHRFQHQ